MNAIGWREVFSIVLILFVSLQQFGCAVAKTGKPVKFVVIVSKDSPDYKVNAYFQSQLDNSRPTLTISGNLITNIKDSDRIYATTLLNETLLNRTISFVMQHPDTGTISCTLQAETSPTGLTVSPSLETWVLNHSSLSLAWDSAGFDQCVAEMDFYDSSQSYLGGLGVYLDCPGSHAILDWDQISRTVSYANSIRFVDMVLRGVRQKDFSGFDRASFFVLGDAGEKISNR